MFDELIEMVKTAIASITPEMILNGFLGFLMFLSTLILYAALPVTFIMIVHSIIIFARQSASYGKASARWATMGIIASYSIGIGVFAAALVAPVSNTVRDEFLELVNYQAFPVLICFLGVIMCLLVLISFVEALKTVFNQKRVIDSYDYEKVGKAVIAHRVHFILFVILLVAAIVYIYLVAEGLIAPLL